jgi:hypothetical protein
MQTKAVFEFIDGAKDRGVKQHLMSSERSLNRFFNQALQLEAINLETGQPVRLWEIRAEASMGT